MFLVWRCFSRSLESPCWAVTARRWPLVIATSAALAAAMDVMADAMEAATAATAVATAATGAIAATAAMADAMAAAMAAAAVVVTCKLLRSRLRPRLRFPRSSFEQSALWGRSCRRLGAPPVSDIRAVSESRDRASSGARSFFLRRPRLANGLCRNYLSHDPTNRHGASYGWRSMIR